MKPAIRVPNQTGKMPKKRTKKTLAVKLRLIKKDWQLYTLLILPVIYLLIFKYGPMYGNIIAFRKYLPGGSIYGEEWVGFHYFNLFIHSSKFWHVLANNLILGLLLLIFTFPAPIILALLLNELTSKKATRFKKFVQTASYLPHFLSVVIVAGMILNLTSETGPINAIYTHITGDKPFLFMQHAGWFRPVYIASDIWQMTGWGTILYLAALTNIDENLYEAAKIDGANRWRQTLHVTIPGIMPMIVVLLTLSIGKFMQVGFEKILLLYNPLIYRTADVISTYLYRVGLQSGSFSYAAAIGLFEAVVGFILVFSANYVSKKITDTSLW